MYMVMVLALWMVFIYVPSEKDQGLVQRIFYLHVSSAFAMSLGGIVAFIASIIYLWKNALWWDSMATSAVEISTLFCALVLITGPIWARPIWGVWWTWDPTLTLTLVLWLIYVAYLMLRANVQEQTRRARFAAVLAIVGGVDVVLIHWSVRKWRTLHPKPVIIQEGGTTGLPPSMLLTLMVCFVAFLLLFLYLLRERVILAQSHHDLETIRQEIDDISRYDTEKNL
jgi:heme exporter protein C